MKIQCENGGEKLKFEQKTYESLGIVDVMVWDSNKRGYIRLAVKLDVYEKHKDEIERLLENTLTDLINFGQVEEKEELESEKSVSKGSTQSSN